MKVLVVDDHPLFREGLRTLIERMEPAARVIESDSCEAALALAAREAPELDLILLDLALPGMNGLEGIARFRERFATTPVVMVSASYDARHVKQAIDRGAQGFIPKSTPPDVLASALRLIFSGGVYVPPYVLEPLPGPASAGARAALTSAQSRVLELMARGQSNKAIGNALDISDNTVRAHVSAILRALGVTNRTEAVAIALQAGLVAHDG
ncbi:MAG TPA: response regulator transcription factor [Usitatibacter sp.]|nr:response regulator transcription factor [Usitatibacter sp.]